MTSTLDSEQKWRSQSTQATPLADNRGEEATGWQWEHKTGWRPYGAEVSARIQVAFDRGESLVRLKVGKGQLVPKELYLYDMLQYDPVSQNTRKIRQFPKPSPLRILWRVTNMLFTLKAPKKFKDRLAGQGVPSKAEQVAMLRHSTMHNISGMQSIWAHIAKNNAFRFTSRALVCVSCIAIGIEADLEAGDDSPAFSQHMSLHILNHILAFYFCMEAVIRFAAYQDRRECLEDVHFMFDMAVALLMTVECWMMTAVLIAGSTASPDWLQALQAVRLVRLVRVMRVLKQIPEVLTLIRGIIYATRAVIVTSCMLLVLLYMFGIIFVSQSHGKPRENYFSSLGHSMWTLLLQGTLLDDISTPLNDLSEQREWTLIVTFLAYVFLSSFTLLNMLLGMLCDVISNVTTAEKHALAESELEESILAILECYDTDEAKGFICQTAFTTLTQNPEFIRALKKFNVQVDDVCELEEVIFDKHSHGHDNEPDPSASPRSALISFRELLDIILRLHDNSGATVNDIAGIQRHVAQLQERLDKSDCRQQEVLSRLEDISRMLRAHSCLSTSACNMEAPVLE
eukprot:TRINITY_DN105082_c0_g1_i1.p1 TRINITY_DN105082_c0_g1~~TRINITY_DN105082_c0_g1_i1.p1  ORF type:complete len:586 (+),score=68.83 TRINITY_DN105082_c0_g1_i1:49-1758(+)